MTGTLQQRARATFEYVWEHEAGVLRVKDDEERISRCRTCRDEGKKEIFGGNEIMKTMHKNLGRRESQR